MSSQNKLFMLPCFKTKQIDRQFDQGQALVYLKLRADGCSMDKALNFCKVKHCKTDTTSLIAGPNDHRILKLNQNKLYQNNIINGWLINVNPEYDMGKQFIMNKQRNVLKTDDVDDKIVRDLEQQNNSLKNDYKQRELYLKKYMQELNVKYNFRSKNRQDLHNKLQEIIQDSDKLNLGVKQCYKLKNDTSDLKFFEITSYFKEKEKQFIHPLGSYPSMLNEQQEQQLVYTEFKREEKPQFLIEEKYHKELKVGEQDEQIADIQEKKDSIEPDQNVQFSKEAKIRAMQEQFNDSIYLIHNETKKEFKKKDTRSLAAISMIGINQSTSSYIIGSKKVRIKEIQKNDGEMKELEKGLVQKKKKINDFKIPQKFNKQSKNKLQKEIIISATVNNSTLQSPNSSTVFEGENKIKFEFENKLRSFLGSQIDALNNFQQLNKIQINDKNLQKLISIKNNLQFRSFNNQKKFIQPKLSHNQFFDLNQKIETQSFSATNNYFYNQKFKKDTKHQKTYSTSPFQSPNSTTTYTQAHNRINSLQSLNYKNFQSQQAQIVEQSHEKA